MEESTRLGYLRIALRVFGFLFVFAVARVIRFGVEGMLARRYGASVLRMLESELAQQIVIGLVIVSILGTAIAIVRLWRGTRRPATASR